jgi:hypothetical protein
MVGHPTGSEFLEGPIRGDDDVMTGGQDMLTLLGNLSTSTQHAVTDGQMWTELLSFQEDLPRTDSSILKIRETQRLIPLDNGLGVPDIWALLGYGSPEQGVSRYDHCPVAQISSIVFGHSAIHHCLVGES